MARSAPRPAAAAQVPRADEAERSVIGGVLSGLCPLQLLDQILAVLAERDLWQPAHRAIWGRAVALREAGRVVTLAAIADELHRRGAEGVPPTLLAELANEVSTVDGLLGHAHEVRRASVRRELLERTVLLQERLHQGLEVDELPAQIARLRELELAIGRPQITLALPSQRIAELFAQRPQPPVALGLMQLDQELQGGLLAGRPTVLIARTGRGKTSFKTQVVINWLQQGYDVLDLQTELPEVEAYARYLAQLQQTPWRGLLAQRGQPAAVRDLRAWAAHHLDEHLTLLEFDGQRSLGEVVDEYVRLRGKIPLICVDVVQDLATFTIRGAGGRLDPRSAMREVSHQCKTLARRLGTVVFLVSHTSRAFAQRAAKPGRPLSPSDYEGAGRDSADIEQDASTVLYLDTQDADSQGVAHCDLHIAKQQGPRVTVPLCYRGAIGLFEPAPPRKAQDNRKAQDAILEFLRGRDPSRRYGAGFSGAQLKRGLREAGISRRDGEFYALLRAMVDAGEITRRELNANLTLYYHPTRAPKVGDQLGFDEESA